MFSDVIENKSTTRFIIIVMDDINIKVNFQQQGEYLLQLTKVRQGEYLLRLTII